MRKHFLPVFLMLLCALPAALAQEKPKSLYERVGRYDAIAAIVDDFVKRLAGDPAMKHFFTGLSNASKMRNRQLIVDQLCMETGGPCFYIGRPMKMAHAGLDIREADWEAAGKHMLATFTKLKIGQREQEELNAILDKLKPDIVTKEGEQDQKKDN